MDRPLKDLAVTRLKLHQFRNYESCDLTFPETGPILLLGENGVGKTNLLEAVSLVVPGKGLRHATWQEMQYEHQTDQPWAIHASLLSTDGETSLGMQHQFTSHDEDEGGSKRLIKIDGEICRKAERLAELMKLFWLTPQMGYLLLTGMSARRRFFDRLTTYFDPHHSRHLNQYEKLMRSRLHLLRQPNPDSHWLSGLEQQMAEHAIAIAAARMQMLTHLENQMIHLPAAFPPISFALSGFVEDGLSHMSALDTEEAFQEILAQSRAADRQAHRTEYGVHRTQFQLHHQLKAMASEQCSTGEQKMMMLTLILAVLYAQMHWHHVRPVLLLDDVAAHVDAPHREALFSFLLETGIQVFLTGTDKPLFTPLLDEAFVLEIKMSNCITMA